MKVAREKESSTPHPPPGDGRPEAPADTWPPAAGALAGPPYQSLGRPGVMELQVGSKEQRVPSVTQSRTFLPPSPLQQRRTQKATLRLINVYAPA
eukprot:g12914.t1